MLVEHGQLITRQRMARGRTLVTSTIHLEVIHVYGQTGSNQKSMARRSVI
nr:hypothetical protein [Streptomyces ureilyticus]